MALEVSCPNCSRAFRVAEKHLGKRAQCPTCSTRFTIAIPSLSHPPPPAGAELPPPPASPERGLPEPADPVRDQAVPAEVVTPADLPPRISSHVDWYTGKRGAIAAAVVAGAVLVGFLLGQIHSTSSRTTDRIVATMLGAPRPVDFGQPFTAPGIQLALVDAKVGRPEVRTMLREMAEGRDDVLLLTLRVKNTDPQKTMEFHGVPGMLGAHSILRDEQGEIINGITYGIGPQVLGALPGGAKIAPGEERTHVEIFMVPPAGAGTMTFTIDLAVFGGQGKADFRLPLERIENYTPRASPFGFRRRR